jgi:hypothetical protein
LILLTYYWWERWESDYNYEEEIEGWMGVESKLLGYMGGKVSLGWIGQWARWQSENGLMQCLFHNWTKGKITCPQTWLVEKNSGKWMCKVAWLSRVLGKSYINLDGQHVWNEKIYAIIGHIGIQLQDEWKT